MDINTLKTSMNRGILLGKKHSPELLMIGGIVGIFGSTVLACKATLKAEDVLHEADIRNVRIEEANEKYGGRSYSEQDYLRDRALSMGITIKDFSILYGPAAILGVLSVGALIGSNRILNQRNAALVGAYKLVDSAFKSYRKRVIDEFGEEVDTYIRYKKPYENGFKVVDKKKNVKEVDWNSMENADLSGELYDDDRMGMPSEYARFYDESSPQWRGEKQHDEFFLKAQQTFANDKLHVQGHLFLNEVYDMLGLPRSRAGAVVGWIADGDGDSFVDFDMWNPHNAQNRDAVNGYTPRWLLDFNVDGIIYDAI